MYLFDSYIYTHYLYLAIYVHDTVDTYRLNYLCLVETRKLSKNKIEINAGQLMLQKCFDFFKQIEFSKVLVQRLEFFTKSTTTRQGLKKH